MNIKGILFDVNGTLIDIQTDEYNQEIYRAISRFLTYQGIHVHHKEVKDDFFRLMGEQRKVSPEEFPEFNVVALWREFLSQRGAASPAVPAAKLKQMPLFLAEMFRSLSMNRLQLYPDVKIVLDELVQRFKLAAVSDAQSAWGRPEMRAVGIEAYFSPITVSGDLGYRKPDRRIFEKTLARMKLEPKNALFVGNDMYRDIFGAGQVGLTTVFLSSNQGRKSMDGVKPDYIIYNFGEIRQAIEFFQNR